LEGKQLEREREKVKGRRNWWAALDNIRDSSSEDCPQSTRAAKKNLTHVLYSNFK
jgi:hypothetical protein